MKLVRNVVGFAAALALQQMVREIFPEIVPSTAILGELTPGFAAENAGLEPGDRVVELAGEDVRYFNALVEIVHAVSVRIVENDADKVGIGVSASEVLSHHDGHQLLVEPELNAVAQLAPAPIEQICAVRFAQE